MKICQACNLKYENEKSFCRQCGGALVKDVTATPEVIVKRQGFEKRIDSEPHNVEHLLAYGEYLASVSLHTESLVQFLKAQEIDAKHGAVLRGLATAYQALKQPEKAAWFLARISALLPNDADVLVQRLDVLRKLEDKEAEILEVCKALHAIRPFAYPACSLFLGIAQHATIPWSALEGRPEAEKLLAHAFSASTAYSDRETACGTLHWCHARLRLGHEASQTAEDLKVIDRALITAREAPILADCLFLLGKAWLERDLLTEAIVCFNDSIRVAETPAAHEQLAKAHEIRGDLQAAKGQGGAASKAYAEALKHCPGKTDLQAKINAIQAKQARRTRTIVAAVSVVIAIAALFYYGQGSLVIRADQPSAISLGEPSFKISETGHLETPLLFYRSYALKITKPGYATIDQNVKPAFGRGNKVINFTLEPNYGTVKVDSDPAGATAVVRNPYEEKTCTTPCELSKLFAMSSEVELRLAGYESFVTKLDVPAAKTHDLGTVTFKGDLKVASTPSEAEVFVNGKSQGKTPLSLKGLPAQKTALEIRKKGEGLYVASVPIAPGKENDLGVVTLSTLGAIRVDSAPSGASIQLDGKWQEGKTPLIVNSLEVGRHSVRLEYPGVQAFEKEVALAAGEVLDMGVVSFLGSIKVGSKPSGAEVYVNGEKKGVTPLTVPEVLAKEASLRLVHGELAITVPAKVRRNEAIDLGVVNLSGLKDPVTGMEFVMVAGGCFQMGSPLDEKDHQADEGPVHEVCVDPFLMGKYEVTVGQFKKFAEATGYRTEAESEGWCYAINSNGSKWEKTSGRSWRDPGFQQADNEPVVCVSWNDAQRFVSWMNDKGKGARLPTEAEWEYAARAGSKRSRPWGDNPDGACQHGNVGDRTVKQRYSRWGWPVHDCDDGYVNTAPVGRFKANTFGLYDMIGNAWEWCSDWYGESYYASFTKHNPGGPSSGSGRVNRGGGWIGGPGARALGVSQRQPARHP